MIASTPNLKRVKGIPILLSVKRLKVSSRFRIALWRASVGGCAMPSPSATQQKGCGLLRNQTNIRGDKSSLLRYLQASLRERNGQRFGGQGGFDQRRCQQPYVQLRIGNQLNSRFQLEADGATGKFTLRHP